MHTSRKVCKHLILEMFAVLLSWTEFWRSMNLISIVGGGVCVMCESVLIVGLGVYAVCAFVFDHRLGKFVLFAVVSRACVKVAALHLT